MSQAFQINIISFFWVLYFCLILTSFSVVLIKY